MGFQLKSRTLCTKLVLNELMVINGIELIGVPGAHRVFNFRPLSAQLRHLDSLAQGGRNSCH